MSLLLKIYCHYCPLKMDVESKGKCNISENV